MKSVSAVLRVLSICGLLLLGASPAGAAEPPADSGVSWESLSTQQRQLLARWRGEADRADRRNIAVADDEIGHLDVRRRGHRFRLRGARRGARP